MTQIKDKNLIINKRGLYIHVPFCDSLCSYCDFAKMHNHESLIKPYLNALKKEIESDNIKDIKTIYIGGGTPSCLSLEYLKQLLDIVNPYFNEDIQEYRLSGPGLCGSVYLLIMCEGRRTEFTGAGLRIYTIQAV